MEDGWFEVVGGDGIVDGLNVGIFDYFGFEYVIGIVVGFVIFGFGGSDSGCYFGLIVWIWGEGVKFMEMER